MTGLRATFVLLVLGGVALFGARVTAGSAANRTLTIYSYATGVQYLNNIDDRIRGLGNNPFSKELNKLQTKSVTGSGPFPGDVAVYSFDLYAGPSLKKSAGSAFYTCYYNYAQHALCQASYVLSGRAGTLVASGPVNFNDTHFKLIVTGGTKKYLGASGELSAAPAARNAQRLDFLLLG